MSGTPGVSPQNPDVPTASPDPKKPRPCPSSCRTTVRKLYLPATGAPLVPKSQFEKALLNWAWISYPAFALGAEGMQNLEPASLSASGDAYHVFATGAPGKSRQMNVGPAC